MSKIELGFYETKDGHEPLGQIKIPSVSSAKEYHAFIMDEQIFDHSGIVYTKPYKVVCIVDAYDSLDYGSEFVNLMFLDEDGVWFWGMRSSLFGEALRKL